MLDETIRKFVGTTSDLRVAIVHYWLVNQGGGERVLDELCSLFPQADLFAVVANSEKLSPIQRSRRLTTSFVQRLPGSVRWYRHFVPLYPLALENLDLVDYDLVISSESGPAKGVITRPDACHICYCHSPMRYIWDMYPSYVRSMGLATKLVFSASAHYLRMWDVNSAKRVDHFVANSTFVKARILKLYRRGSKVIYPPVDVANGFISERIEDYYLVVGRLTDYKRVDLAIKAFNHNKRTLHIVGDGPDYKKLQRIAGANIKFLGKLSHDLLQQEYAGCRALIFPGEEDFGIVPVEAQSYGRPVIAYRGGGVRDSVIGGKPEISTGVFFSEQTPASLEQAVKEFEKVENSFDPRFIRRHAQQFSREAFRHAFMDFVASKWATRERGERNRSRSTAIQ